MKGIKAGQRLLGAVLFLMAQAGLSATIQVDTTGDGLNNGSDCSLREAVRSINTGVAAVGCSNSANDGFGTADRIELPADVGDGIYTLRHDAGDGTEDNDARNADLDLTNTVEIVGVRTAGGSAAVRGKVRIEPLTPSFDGQHGRAFDAHADTTIKHLTIRGFRVEGRNNGGAILGRSGASLTLEDAVLADNEASFGGALQHSDLTLITESLLENNHARLGGGAVHQDESSLTIKRTSLVQNRAGTHGGALELDGGTVQVEHATFIRNVAGAGGGGYEGGAIRVFSPKAGAQVQLLNITVVNNSATADGGGLMIHEDAPTNGNVEVRNAIIAGNRAGEQGRNCRVMNAASVGSQTGYNLIGDSDQCSALMDSESIGDTSMQLAAPGDYDGNAPIRPPLSGSAAIDNGSCTDLIAEPVTVDQRGASRDIDGNGDDTTGCDMGAVERQKVAMMVDHTGDTLDQNPGDGSCMDSNGNCTLRAAIDEANSDDTIDEIVLPEGKVTLSKSGIDEDDNATGDLDVKSPLILRGQGADTSTVDADGIDRVLQTTSNGITLSLRALHLTGGDTVAYSGDGAGGGVYSGGGGELNVAEAAITNNAAGEGSGDFGGGIFADGTTRILRTTIRGNEAVGSGGGGLALLTGSGDFARIVHTTMVDNEAPDAQFKAAGLYLGNVARATVVRSTLAGDNRVISSAANSRDSVLEMRGSVVAGECGLSGSSGFSATLTSLGHNLETGTSCGFTQSSDQQSTTPDLAAPADAGAPVQLRVPNADSPLVDAGSCSGVSGRILPRTPFGSTRPQDAAASGGTGDGTYDCDIGAAERQQVRLAQGSNAPSDRQVSAGSTDVVIAQFQVTNESGNPVAGDSPVLALSASGSGDEAVDVSQVRLYRDMNGDGQLDSGDVQRGSAQSFSQDDGRVQFDFANTSGSTPSDLAPGASRQYLVVYDFASQLAASDRGLFSGTALVAGLAGGGGTLAVLFGLVSAGALRGRPRIWLVPLAAAMLSIAACGGGGGGNGGNNGSDGTGDDDSNGGSGTPQMETFSAALTEARIEDASNGRVINLRVKPVQSATMTVSE